MHHGLLSQRCIGLRRILVRRATIGSPLGESGTYTVYHEEDVPENEDVPSALMWFVKSTVTVNMMVGDVEECESQASSESESQTSSSSNSYASGSGNNSTSTSTASGYLNSMKSTSSGYLDSMSSFLSSSASRMSSAAENVMSYSVVGSALFVLMGFGAIASRRRRRRQGDDEDDESNDRFVEMREGQGISVV